MRVIGLAVVFLFLFGAVACFAQTFSTAKNDGGMWVEESVFDLSEKPWLHINVPDADFKNQWVLSFWNHQASTSSTYMDNFLYPFSEFEKVGTSDLYLAFDNTAWESIKKIGDWDVSAAVVLAKPGPNLSTNLQAYSGNANFKVVPEPFAAQLFLIGGGVISFFIRKRKSAQDPQKGNK